MRRGTLHLSRRLSWLEFLIQIKETLPSELRELLNRANLNISMWAHSINTVSIIAQLGAAQFANLELSGAVRELVTLFGAREFCRLRMGPARGPVQSHQCD